METKRIPRRVYPGPAEEKKTPRMRTAANIVREIRKLDPDSDVTEHWVRCLSKSGRVPVVKAGSKSLINLDDVLDLLRLGVEVEAEPRPSEAPKVVPLPPQPQPQARGIRRIEV